MFEDDYYDPFAEQDHEAAFEPEFEVPFDDEPDVDELTEHQDFAHDDDFYNDDLGSLNFGRED